ncbi:MAG: Mfa1 family fimbria major subunit [Tannerellaceae bacterium]|jgi:hypothetical protein|nr:Mfa1 family fimbria major subunit [Tannerellaceae bacterium]
MKKMFKLFMCAAVVAAGFTACSEEVTPIPGPDVNPTETGLLTINFKNPTTYATDNGTPGEGKLRDVTVFVFNSSGVCEIDTLITLAQLEATNPGDQTPGIQHKAVNINVKTGFHTVYAGINLTSGDATKMREILRSANGFNQVVYLGTTDAQPKFTPNITEIQKLYVDNEFPMFSADVQSLIIKSVPVGAANPNQVIIPLDRMVAKITVRRGADFSNPINLTVDGATFSATDLSWDLGNLNGKIYPYGRANNNTNDPNYDDAPASLTNQEGLDYRAANFVTTFGTKGSSVVGFTTSVNDNDVIINNRNARYAPENNSLTGRGHESTYASIKAKFAPTKVYTYTSGDPEPKEATGSAPTLSGSETFYVVAYTQTYYFRDPNQANEYKNFLLPKDQSITVKEYKNQFCFYPLFMGTGETKRNYYYDITLNKFTGLGDPTGELDEEEGNQTVDKKGLLDVTININPWTIVEEEHPLGK